MKVLLIRKRSTVLLEFADAVGVNMECDPFTVKYRYLLAVRYWPTMF